MLKREGEGPCGHYPSCALDGVLRGEGDRMGGVTNSAGWQVRLAGAVAPACPWDPAACSVAQRAGNEQPAGGAGGGNLGL